MSPQEQWQLAGNAPESYERYLVPALFAPWARDLVEQVALQPGERVLDVACGTGVVARCTAQQVGPTGSVMGLDVNPGMVAVASTRTPRTGVTITWREGSAVAMPCADASFDVVLCQQGLQFFPDRPTALREMRRVLAPGGRLALSVWRSLPHNPYNVILSEAVARHVSPEAGANMRAPCSFGDREALRAVITGGGFHEVRIRLAVRLLRFQSVAEFIPGDFAARPLLAGAVAALDAATRAALLSEISEALQSYRDDEGFAVPVEAHVVVART
jgi:SAM-dependent methyltransferase